MDKEKLKLIVRNLELLVDALKVELYTDVQKPKAKINQKIDDYDEVFEEYD